MLADGIRAALLRHARATVTAWLDEAQLPPAPAGGAYDEHRAVFVTVRDGAELRGCIGHLETDLPLGVVVGRCAVQAAAEDPRFAPLTARELGQVRFEISVLLGLTRATWDQVIPGRHGVIVRRRARRGLLLPQVAVEHELGREGFLDLACRKARLPAGSWRDAETTIETFEAEVFAE